MIYVNWRISSRRFSKWHRQHEKGWTVCGQTVPEGAASAPPTTHRADADDECATCKLYDTLPRSA